MHGLGLDNVTHLLKQLSCLSLEIRKLLSRIAIVRSHQDLRRLRLRDLLTKSLKLVLELGVLVFCLVRTQLRIFDSVRHQGQLTVDFSSELFLQIVDLVSNGVCHGANGLAHHLALALNSLNPLYHHRVCIRLLRSCLSILAILPSLGDFGRLEHTDGIVKLKDLLTQGQSFLRSIEGGGCCLHVAGLGRGAMTAGGRCLGPRGRLSA